MEENKSITFEEVIELLAQWKEEMDSGEFEPEEYEEEEEED